MMDYTILFVTGIAAGFISAIIGGGGMISIPVMIFLGLPPQMAIGTNKLGALGTWVMAFPKYWQAGKIRWNFVALYACLSITGGYIGARMLLTIPEDVLKPVIAVFILIFVAIAAMSKKFGVNPVPPTKFKLVIGTVINFVLCVVTGFFSGGTGVLFAFANIYFFGLTIMENKATAIIPYVLLLLTAFATLAFQNQVNYPFAAVLFGGMLVGGWWGSHTAINKGDDWVKRVFILTSGMMALKLLWDAV